MNLLKKLFSGLKGEQAPPQPVDVKKIAEKLAEFTKTRGKVAAETRRQRTGDREEDAPDRPPDVLQGAMAGITAAQVTQALKGPLQTARLAPRERARDAKGRYIKEAASRPVIPRPGPWASERVEPSTRLEDRLPARPEPPTAPVPRDPGEPDRQGIIGGMVARLKEFGQTLKETNAELKRLQKPISEEVQGLTLEQRHQRLKAQKALAKPEEAAEAIGGPGAKEWLKPSKAQIVEFSESQQQKKRQEEIKRRFGEKAAASRPVGRAGVLGMAGAHPIATAATIAAGSMLIFGRKLAALSSTVVERNKELRGFSPAMAGAYARLEAQRFLRRSRLAEATGESGAAAAAARGRFERAKEPVQQIGTGLLNRLSKIGSDIGALGLEAINQTQAMNGLQMAMMAMEAEQRRANRQRGIGGGMTFYDFYRQMQQAPPPSDEPVNKPPGWKHGR